jgi:hypothetical protein
MLSVICGPWSGIDRPLSDVSRHVPCSAEGVVVCCVSEAMRLAAIAIPAIVAMKDFMSILILRSAHGITPAMEAGVATHIWSVEEIVGLLG